MSSQTLPAAALPRSHSLRKSTASASPPHSTAQLRSDAASRAEFFTLIGANQQEMMHHD